MPHGFGVGVSVGVWVAKLVLVGVRVAVAVGVAVRVKEGVPVGVRLEVGVRVGASWFRKVQVRLAPADRVTVTLFAPVEKLPVPLQPMLVIVQPGGTFSVTV
jgi:hypothetical protein